MPVPYGSNAAYIWSQNQLQPAYYDRTARIINVTLAPGTYQSGQVLGAITSANTQDVQTVTVSGAPTHSTITFTNLPGGLTYTAAQDVTPAALQTALNNLLGANAYAVTGTYAAGAGGTYILTAGSTGPYANQPLSPVGVAGSFVGGTTPAVANVHTTTGIGPNGAFGIYASGNTDGSQNAKGLLKYGCTVNSLGQVTISTEIPGVNTKNYYAGMYRSGAFRTEDLVGLDAAAVTAMDGLIVVGTTTTGLLEFGMS